MEERGLSSRRTSNGARDPGDWHEPINSVHGSEAADGVARQSEGIAHLSFLYLHHMSVYEVLIILIFDLADYARLQLI